MAQITDNTRIELISGLSKTSSLDENDLLLLQRGFKSYAFTYTDLISSISDLIEVNSDSINNINLVDGSVTSAKIANKTIVDEDVSDDADISGLKIRAVFGEQNVKCQGNVTAFGDANGLGLYTTGTAWIKDETALLRLEDALAPLSSRADIYYDTNKLSINVDRFGKYTTEDADIIFLNRNTQSLTLKEDLNADFSGNIECGKGGDVVGLLSNGDIWSRSTSPAIRLQDTTESSYANLSYDNNSFSINVDPTSSYGAFNANIAFFNRDLASLTLREDLVVIVHNNLQVDGDSNASGTKTFKINHPLKPDDNYLVHNSVESPECNNLYRGKTSLVDGEATVNIDDYSGMTDGTFVALNKNIQCFTTNEDGWTQVRGNVVGNILNIEAQDSSCNDEVSWLVIGQRQDDSIKKSSSTNENGDLIVEPLK